MRRRTTPGFCAAALAACASLAACNTPQIPITPPAVPTDTLVATDLGNGTFAFTGTGTVPKAGDLLFIYDRATQQGVIALGDARGNVATGPLVATAGDLLELWFEDPSVMPPEQSEHDCVALRAGTLPAVDTSKPSCP